MGALRPRHYIIIAYAGLLMQLICVTSWIYWNDYNLTGNIVAGVSALIGAPMVASYFLLLSSAVRVKPKPEEEHKQCKLKKKYPGLKVKCCQPCLEHGNDEICCNHTLCNGDCWTMCGDNIDCPQFQPGGPDSMNDSTLTIDGVNVDDI